MTHGQRQAPDMVLVRMGQHHGIEAAAFEEREVRGGGRTHLARMHSGVEEDAGFSRFEEVAVGPDFLGAGEIGELHCLTFQTNRPDDQPGQ